MRGLVSVDRAQAAKPFEPVVRERVIERLAAAATYRVALVSAPAGFGKTVAVRQYLERYDVPHVRFALRREHADLLGFVRGLLEALAPVVGDATVAASADICNRSIRASTANADLSAWIAALLRDHDGTIVVDDLHVGAGDPAVSALLAALIERSGDALRWVLATRESHALPVSTWLAYGTMDLPIDEVDLRLTLAEATAAATAFGARMHEADVSDLLTLTEGWPTAFCFALRANGRSADAAHVVAGTREMIYGFFAEQVFDALDIDDAEFLLRTCLLPVVDIRALESHGWPSASQIVARLSKQTSFIARESSGTFRYHDLFRDFLQDRLRRAGKLTFVAANTVAARFLEAQGTFAEALRMYVDAGAVDDVARIVGERGLSLLDRGEIGVLELALGAIDPEHRSRDVRLVGVAAGVLALTGRFDRSDSLFRIAELNATSEDHRADVAFRHAGSLLQRMKVTSALEVLNSISATTIAADQLRARFLAAKASSLAYHGELESATALVEQALDLARTCDDQLVEALVRTQAAGVHFNADRLERADEHARRGLAIAQSLKAHRLAARAGSIVYAVAYERGDQDECLRRLVELRRSAECAGDQPLIHYADLSAYDLAAERGEHDKLASIERRLGRAADSDEKQRTSEALLPAIALQAAWLGAFDRAYEIVASTASEQSSQSRRILRLAEVAVYAAASGRREAAELVVKQLTSRFATVSGHAMPHSVRTMKARSLFACALMLMGRWSSANAVIRSLESVATSFPDRIHHFVRAVRAIYIHGETGYAHEELGSALAAMRSSGYGGFAQLLEALPLTSGPPEPTVGSLTLMESRVLQALAGGATSREIAADLQRTTNTVDTHVKAIVRKFQCRGRREAVALARHRGWV